jgi:hypothetical protein
MKRFALIIESSECPGETKLDGAKADAVAYHGWLYSKPGGDWFDSEMVTLHTPTINEVKRAISNVGKVDYAFVAFSGHGFHSKELDLTKLCLKDGYMGVREIIPDTERSTVVIDACCNIMPEIFTETIERSLAEVARFSKMAMERDYRKIFESWIADAEKGPIFLYSCDLDESAGESRLGGYFSRFLVEVGRRFAQGNQDGRKWFSTEHAFNIAANDTTLRNRTQHPIYEPGRRRNHFPFGV